MGVRARLLRLKKRKDFVRIARTGRASAMPGLVLQCAAQPSDGAPGQARVGYTASRKVGGAVDRNRAKRRLRAAADQVIPHHAKPDRDYVLIARKVTLKRRFADLVRDLDRALMRVGGVDRAGDDSETKRGA